MKWLLMRCFWWSCFWLPCFWWHHLQERFSSGAFSSDAFSSDAFSFNINSFALWFVQTEPLWIRLWLWSCTLEQMFSISNWQFLIPCYHQNSERWFCETPFVPTVCLLDIPITGRLIKEEELDHDQSKKLL